MSFELEEFQLGSRCSIKSSKRIFAKEYVEEGVPFWRSKDVIDKALGSFSHYELFISEERFREIKKTHGCPQRGDILISSVGNRSGQAYVVQDEGDFHFKDGNILWLSEFEGIDSDFLAYWLTSDVGQINLASVMIGSAQKALTIDALRKLWIQFPPFNYQSLAVNVLKYLDQKISVNKRINQTLEQMAQAIFKSWFVDFEPVKAKIAARERWHDLQTGNESASPVCYVGELAGQPINIDLDTYMNHAAMQAISGKDAEQLALMQVEKPEEYAELYATAELFPSAMQDSELGRIPEGWGIGAFNDLCLTVESGGTPKRSESAYWGGEIKWLSSGEVRDVIVLDTKEKITESGLRNSSAKLWPKYTTVVAMYGATAGQVCMLANEMAANQACCGLIPKDQHGAFVFINARNSIDSLADKASGSAQQNLNKGLVSSHPTILPPLAVLTLYESISLPFIHDRVHNSQLTNLLINIRDTLLPKLLSGELSVADIESEVEA